MMPALAQITDEIEIESAAAAECQRWSLRARPWTVGCDQHVSREVFAMGRDQLIEPLRARFLAHLDHELDVEPKPSALLEHRLKRRQVDRVLALVVSGAAAVEPIALSRRDPRSLALGPLVVQPADDVAVAVAKDGRQARVLYARGQQHWALALDGVGIDAAREAHPRQSRLHLVS